MMRFLLILLLARVSMGAEIIPSDRRVTWQDNVGVPGGIVHRTNLYLMLPAGSTRAQILTALNSSSTSQYVLLTNGTYTMDDTLRVPTGKVLRGMGSNTIVDGGGGQPITISPTTGWHSWEQETIVSASSAAHTNWTSGYSQGTTNIVLTNASAFTVGKLIILDQLNDANASVYGNSDSGNPYSIYEYTSEAHLNDGRDRCQFQMNRIAAKSGNTVTLEIPIYMPNYTSSLSPQAWRFATSPVTNAGIEDLRVDVGGVDGCCSMDVAYGCWMTNVTVHSSTATRGFIFLKWTLRCSVIDSQVIADVQEIDTYGIRTRGSAAALVQNCWGDGLRAPFTPNGCSGSVWAYNFATNCQTTGFFFQSGFLQHGGFPNMNLYEGNWAPGLGGDNVWGGCNRNTWFRNRFTGKDSDPGGSHGNLEAAALMSTNRHCQIIGNILGQPSLLTYQDDGTTACHSDRVYFLGTYDPGSGCSGVYDPIVVQSLIRAVNWTSATTTNSGVINDGYSPSDLPNSYYLASKPAFFGDLTWPPIDPSNPSVLQSALPAAYRYLNGVNPPPAPTFLRARIRPL